VFRPTFEDILTLIEQHLQYNDGSGSGTRIPEGTNGTSNQALHDMEHAINEGASHPGVRPSDLFQAVDKERKGKLAGEGMSRLKKDGAPMNRRTVSTLLEIFDLNGDGEENPLLFLTTSTYLLTFVSHNNACFDFSWSVLSTLQATSRMPNFTRC
jgi:hypothetical protein